MLDGPKRGWADCHREKGTVQISNHPLIQGLPPPRLHAHPSRPTLLRKRDHQLGAVGFVPQPARRSAELLLKRLRRSWKSKKEEESSYRQVSRCQLHSQVALHSWPLIICGLSALVENPASEEARERERDWATGEYSQLDWRASDETEMTGRLPVLRRLLYPSDRPLTPSLARID